MDSVDLERVFRRNYADMVAFCRRRLPAGDVDDAVAEIFATLWRRVEQVDSDAVRPWLFGVARNVIGTQYRSRERRHRAESRLLNGRHLVAVPDPALVVAEVDLVDVAAGRLSAADRELLELISWEGLDAAELAAVLDCSTAVIHVRVHRLRDRLRTHMDELMSESTPLTQANERGAQ